VISSLLSFVGVRFLLHVRFALFLLKTNVLAVIGPEASRRLGLVIISPPTKTHFSDSKFLFVPKTSHGRQHTYEVDKHLRSIAIM